MEKKTENGTEGKGGPLLRISTSQGDIALKKASIMPLPPLPPIPPKITTLPPLGQEPYYGVGGIAW